MQQTSYTRGKATVPFLGAGYNVTAVEISANMEDFISARFKENNNVNVIVDSFEDVLLQENSYDLIYAASAFHWVDAEIGCPKAFRLLKNGGVIALFRYNEIASAGEKLHDEIRMITKKYYCSFYQLTYLQPVRMTHKDFEKTTENYKGFRFEDLRAYGFHDILMKFYDVTRTYSADEYIEFLDTLSDHRNLPESNSTSLYSEIKEKILKHGGYYKVDYIFQLYMGRK